MDKSFFLKFSSYGFFTYGSLFAIQTLWAGPWLITVAGYTPEESAQGLFLFTFQCYYHFCVGAILFLGFQKY